MDITQFRQQAHKMVDWMADYYSHIESYPVKSQVRPGEIKNKLPGSPPEKAEAFDNIFRDFEETILPGITHWQSPNFFAYFPANSSYPSVLGEMLTATLGIQGMIWETSPAATELEETVMNWLKKMTGIPESFHGVIQDTASTATLVALITARERISEFQVNEIGFLTNKYRIYCSTEAHSSIEKAVKIAGFGREALVKVEVDNEMKMKPEMLEECIKNDIMEGLIPACVVSALGTTGTAAIDPLDEISEVCRRYKVWHHVDAAYAGTALVLKEYRYMIKGIEKADSIVFNPHKWMFTNFDCSAYFVRDRDCLLKTFEIMPEYLKTAQDKIVNNYRDWGIQLGRRFRALKLWFVIRNFGAEGIRKKVRDQITWSKRLAEKIRNHNDFILHEPQNLAVVCFRIRQEGEPEQEKRNAFSQKLLDTINSSGSIYLSHTKVKGEFTFRLVSNQTYVTEDHINRAWDLIVTQLEKLKNEK